MKHLIIKVFVIVFLVLVFCPETCRMKWCGNSALSEFMSKFVIYAITYFNFEYNVKKVLRYFLLNFQLFIKLFTIMRLKSNMRRFVR